MHNFTDAVFDDARIEDCSFRDARLRAASFSRTAFRGVRLDRADLERAFLLECVVEDARWPGANLSRATLRRLSGLPPLEDCAAEMLHCLDCDLSALRFHRVAAILLVLQGCACAALEAEDCDFSQIVAMRTNLNGARFTRCREASCGTAP